MGQYATKLNEVSEAEQAKTETRSPILEAVMSTPRSPRTPRARGTATPAATNTTHTHTTDTPRATAQAQTPRTKAPTSPRSPNLVERVRQRLTQLPPSPPASPQINRFRKANQSDVPQPRSPQERYQISEKIIGEGAFAKVRLGTNLTTGQKLAVKSFEIPAAMSHEQEEDLRMLRKERDILKKVNHPNIVKLFHYEEDRSRLNVYLELVEGGDLYAWLCERQSISEREALPLFRQMVDALDHCHHSGFCHRDVKLENFLMDRPNCRPVLIDFGFASPLPFDGLYRNFPGSPAYACPSLLQGKPYKGTAADIYALGVVLYTLLHYKYPFYSENRTEMVRQICTAEPRFRPDLSVELVHLLRWMLQKRCEDRPSMEQLRAHNWVRMAAYSPPVRSPVVSGVASSAAAFSGTPAKKTPMKGFIQKFVKPASASMTSLTSAFA